MLVKRLSHPDADIYVEHLGRKFICKDVFAGKEGWSRIDILSTKRFKTLNITLREEVLFIQADTYSFHFINAKRIVEEEDLLEYLIA